MDTKSGELTVILCLEDSEGKTYTVKLDSTDLEFLKDCLDTSDEDRLAHKYC